ncbi:protein-disulfide reductase DsbD domain-containing protein [uncultured Polaribacter sp.]|uniref:protein-disulfide reductase DsbD domain-containing protein n=1 Tax=uncultured Polaribacter sp. TaxID=174711 RepID=UPI00260E06F4|nr:protein-disulfide reductase DsbD domain-containing protein [uncultured Polaribacter sp.]
MDKIQLKSIIAVVLLSFCVSLQAQILQPASWNYGVSKQIFTVGEEVELIFKVELDESWHLYSNIQNYELGPLPTVFEFEPNESYKLVGGVKPMGYKTKFDDVFEVKVNYFEHTAEFRQKVKILSKTPVIKGYYEYQVCTTVDGKCILGDDEFEFTIETTN